MTEIVSAIMALWNEHGIYILLAVAILVMQSALVILLIIQRHLRENAQKKHQESEAKYRMLVEHAPYAILIYDADLQRFVDANASALEMFGCSKEELLSGGPARFYVAEQPDGLPVQESIDRNVARALAGESRTFERNMRNAKGREIICEVNLMKLPAEGKNLLRVSHTDITKRRKAEQSLLNSQRTLATLMNNLPGLAYSCKYDEQWTMLFVSDGCLELTGYSPDSLIGNAQLSYVDLIEPEDRQKVWDEIQQAVEQRESFQLTYRIRSKSGEAKWVWEQGRAIVNEEGEVTSLEGLVIDITDRVEAEHALIRSEARYHKLYESMMDGYLVTDMEGAILEFNQAIINMTGYSAQELGHMHYQQLTPKKWLEKETKINEEQVLVRGYSDLYEKEYVRKDGSVISVEIRAYLEYDDAKQPVHRWSLVRDVTERKRVEEEKRQFYRNTIHSVTDGKLDIVKRDIVAEYVDHAKERVTFSSTRELHSVRKRVVSFCKEHSVNPDRLHLFMTAIGEAMTNALKHADTGTVFFNADSSELYVGVMDSGPGISTLKLPSATLRRGYSSKVSMGMGYTIMLEVADRIMLCTGAGGTTVILFISLTETQKHLTLDSLPDTWDNIPMN